VLHVFDTVFAAISTRQAHIRWFCHPSCRTIIPYSLRVHPSDMPICQTVKDVSTSYDALIAFLESIERFVNRLDIYIRVPSMWAMTEIILKIMVEIICTLALVTKEIKEKQPGECHHLIVYGTGLNS
jgi:hypothetical protein